MSIDERVRSLLDDLTGMASASAYLWDGLQQWSPNDIIAPVRQATESAPGIVQLYDDIDSTYTLAGADTDPALGLSASNGGNEARPTNINDMWIMKVKSSLEWTSGRILGGFVWAPTWLVTGQEILNDGGAGPAYIFQRTMV